MEKRSSTKGRREWVEDEEVVVEQFRELLEDDEPETVRLTLQRPVRLIITGPVTGKQYVFNGAGFSADVDALDAPQMLEKRSAGTCCGGQHQPYFLLGG